MFCAFFFFLLLFLSCRDATVSKCSWMLLRQCTLVWPVLTICSYPQAWLSVSGICKCPSYLKTSKHLLPNLHKNNGICFVKAYSSKKKKSYFHHKATAKQIPAISTDFIICVMEAREQRSPFNMLKHCCTRELLRAKWWKKHLIPTDWTRSPGGRLGAAQTAQKVQLQRFCTDLQCYYSCKFPVQKWTPEPPGDEELLQPPGSCSLRVGLMLGGEKLPYVTQHSISVINAWG